MPVITLPDGSQRQFEQPVSVADVALNIGAGLAKAALAGRINGKLVDTSYVIADDVQLGIVTERDADGVDVIRHSTAHLLANAVQEIGRASCRDRVQISGLAVSVKSKNE